MYKLLITALILVTATIAGVFGGALHSAPETAPTVLGSFNPTGGGTYRLKTSIGTTNTTIALSSFKEPISNIPYTMSYLQSDIGYGTLDPQNTSRKEFVSFTGITQNSDGSATLTGVTRGLTFTPDIVNGCTASSTLRQAHPGQSIFILSDSPCLFREYLPLRTAATSSAVVVFGSTTPPRYDLTGLQKTGTYNATTSEFASIDYVNAIAISGASNATESIKGIVELGTALEVASSTNLGSSGASLVLQSQNATDTPQRGCATGYSATAGAGCTVIAQLTGKIRQTFINLTEAYTWTGVHTFSTSLISSLLTTISASNTTTNALVLNTVPYAFPSSQGAASSVLTNNGSGTLSWTAPDWYLLTSTTTAVTLSGATTSAFTAAFLALCFNAELTGSTYGRTQSVDSAAATKTTGENCFNFDSAGTTSPRYLVADVINISAQRKLVHYTLSANASGAQAPQMIEGTGVWNNTASQITSVSLQTFDTPKLNSGVTIQVYGSNF